MAIEFVENQRETYTDPTSALQMIYTLAFSHVLFLWLRDFNCILKRNGNVHENSFVIGRLYKRIVILGAVCNLLYLTSVFVAYE